MSSLFSALNSSVNALNAQQLGVQVAGNNLANVNNPNYSRQSVQLGSAGTLQSAAGLQSMGITVMDVTQTRSAILDQQVARQIALTAGYSAQLTGDQQAQAALGQTVDASPNASSTGSTTATGLGAAIDDFFNAFQSLAASPSDSGARQTVLQNASILTGRLQQAGAGLAQVTDGLNAQVTSDVGTANGLLKTIATLNGQITQLEGNRPGSALDLRDQRQAALEQLSAVMPVTVTTSATGQLQLNSADGAGHSVLLVNGGTVTGPLAFDGTQVSGGAPATALAISAGSIQGALASKNGAVAQTAAGLDRLAAQLVAAVNAAYNPAGTSGNFFAPAGTTAATIAVAAGVSVPSLTTGASGAAGDNSVALAVAKVASRVFSTAGGDAIDGTVGGFYAGVVTTLGQAVANDTNNVTSQTSVQQLVTNQRDAVSGVDLNQETASLLQYQRAFEASSRVFNTIDGLLDKVINTMGV